MGSTTTDSKSSHPLTLTQAQQLAVISSNVAATVTAAFAERLVGSTRWDYLIVSTFDKIQKTAYEHLKNAKP